MSTGILIMWKEDSITMIDAMQGHFYISIHFNSFANFSGWTTDVYGHCA